MTKKKYIHLGIMLLITLLISICPTIGSLTPLGMPPLQFLSLYSTAG